MIIVLASVLILLAVALLYKSWRAQSTTHFVVALLIWIASGVMWSYALGWEFGVLYTLCLPGILVWPFIARNQVILPAPRNIPLPRPINLNLRSTATHIGHTAVVLVVLMLASVLVTLALCAILPFSIAGKLGLGVVVLPMLWGAAIYHYLATANKGVALGIYALASCLSVPVLFLLPM